MTDSCQESQKTDFMDKLNYLDESMISIKTTEYEALLEDRKVLQALEAAGVDNWEWYEDALGDVT